MECLKRKSMLLVLEVVEQVAHGTPQVSQLVASSSQLKMVAASRVPPSIRGAREYPAPLSVLDVRHLPPPPGPIGGAPEVPKLPFRRPKSSTFTNWSPVKSARSS